MAAIQFERQFHVGADIPSFSKLQISLPWSALEILQQLNPLDEMQMKAVNNHDAVMNITVSRKPGDEVQLNVDGNGQSVFEALENWWNFNIKTIMSPVYLMPKQQSQETQHQAPATETTRKLQIITEGGLAFPDNAVTEESSIEEYNEENFIESAAETSLGAGQLAGSKLVMNQNGTASIINYDMGVVLDIPESETATLVSVDKSWKQNLNLEMQVDEAVEEVGNESFEGLSQNDSGDKTLLAFQCYMCNRQYMKATAMKSHMVRIHNIHDYNPDLVQQVEVKGSHVCNVCNSAWKNKSSLLRHYRKVHKIEGSGVELEDQMLLPRKKRKRANATGIICSICEREFVMAESLRKHINIYHTGHENYKEAMQVMLDAKFAQAKGKGSRAVLPCPLCQSMYAGVKLIKHMKAVHYDIPDFEKILADTSKDIKTKQYRIKHEKRKQSVQCPKCKKFLQKASMYKHQCLLEAKDPDGSKAHYKRPCPKCGKLYSVNSYYSHLSRVHMIVSRGELKVHTCEVCKKNFSALYKLQKHMLVHTEDRPCKCDECGRRFKDAQALKTHTQTVHMKNFRIKCDKCNKGFRTNKSLETHRCRPPDEEESSPTTPQAGVILEFSGDTNTNPGYKIVDKTAGNTTATSSPASTDTDSAAADKPVVNMKDGIVLVKNRTAKGDTTWSPLVPHLVPSMLAANFCKPLEVVLCEAPKQQLDPLSVSTLNMKTKGLLELSKDKKGYSIHPVKVFPSEEKGPKIPKPRYRRLENKNVGEEDTVIKTMHGVNIMDIQKEMTGDSPVRRSGRQRRAPRRPGDMDTPESDKRVIFQVKLSDDAEEENTANQPVNSETVKQADHTEQPLATSDEAQLPIKDSSCTDSASNTKTSVTTTGTNISN